MQRKALDQRPTVICATAPHRNTAVVRPPTATSEMPLPTRSSTIFGNEIEMVLKTNPALSATTTKRPTIIAAEVADIDTSGEVLRAAAWPFASAGTNQK